MSFATDVIDLIDFFSFTMGALTMASAGYKMGAKMAPQQAANAIKNAASKLKK